MHVGLPSSSKVLTRFSLCSCAYVLNSASFVLQASLLVVVVAGSSVKDEKPPCVVNVHGGPTSYVSQGLDWRKQYFTSRGWAWVDVNYRGSSGYGRDYISKLDANWGVVDIQDCISVARHLSSDEWGLVDPKFTHKLESRYLERLMISSRDGKTEEEVEKELEELYQKRSPIGFVENIEVPLLVRISFLSPRSSSTCLFLVHPAQHHMQVQKVHPSIQDLD
ncbi:Alpha/Beta hydrolase protein [Coprinopsis sp. MPI-PUGE-AT-0042]|nr:Alpha/Beta hydrolase protein [Coprinopsis sp. MPI-PUGE-AT-0042]